MRLTLDEALRLADAFSDWIMDQVEEDVTIRRPPDAFSVEVLRGHKRDRQILLREPGPSDDQPAL